jgi:hypothetical protein
MLLNLPGHPATVAAFHFFCRENFPFVIKDGR